MASLADQLYFQRYGTAPLQGLSGLPGANDPFIASALITPYAQRSKEQHNAINSANVTASGVKAPQYQSSQPQQQYGQPQQPQGPMVNISKHTGGTQDAWYARAGSPGIAQPQNQTPPRGTPNYGYQPPRSSGQSPWGGQYGMSGMSGGMGNFFGGMGNFSSPMSGMGGFPQQRQQSAPMQGAGSMNTTPTPQRTRPPALSQNFNNMLYFPMAKQQYY
jgi:hypothetical protein